MSITKDAADHIKNGEVKIISKSENRIVIQVKNHLVIREKRNGRTTDSCDCPHHALFCKENPRCSHKDAATTYLTMRGIC
jgi:hypothetical protein